MPKLLSVNVGLRGRQRQRLRQCGLCGNLRAIDQLAAHQLIAPRHWVDVIHQTAHLLPGCPTLLIHGSYMRHALLIALLLWNRSLRIFQQCGKRILFKRRHHPISISSAAQGSGLQTHGRDMTAGCARRTHRVHLHRQAKMYSRCIDQLCTRRCKDIKVRSYPAHFCVERHATRDSGNPKYSEAQRFNSTAIGEDKHPQILFCVSPPLLAQTMRSLGSASSSIHQRAKLSWNDFDTRADGIAIQVITKVSSAERLYNPHKNKSLA
jgi:hypothetical protein